MTELDLAGYVVLLLPVTRVSNRYAEVQVSAHAQHTAYASTLVAQTLVVRYMW